MTQITVDREKLQILFDTAVNSMDYTSGFLDDEEVEALRAIAVCLGVNPMEATPPNFKCKYTGKHRVWGPAYPLRANHCMDCKAVVDPASNPL